MKALSEPAKDAVMDAAPSYFTQKPVDHPNPLLPPEEKEEYVTGWPLRSLHKWFSKAPPNRKDTVSSPRTSHASSSSPSTLQWIGPNSPASPACDVDGFRKRQGKNILPVSGRCKLTQVMDQRAAP